MADYNISANITADTKGFESGVKKAQSASKKLSKSITDVVKGFGKSGLSGAITSAGLALGGIGLAVGTAVKAIKGMSKALSECAEAYKVQLQAERALDTAISNSPYVSGTASKALKDYASQMQKVSNLGDEEIIPQMTQLIATGRTEAEVMKIIATASDMSASGAMSFDQAVTQLNATLNGNIGRLGQQNAELKGLTEEELKSGKAVEILGEKYKGLAKATVDTKKQLKNAIGDLKETFGSVFENAISPMRKFFAELIQGWADARKAKQDYEQSTKDVAQGTGDIEDYQNVIAGKQKELEDLKSALNSLMTDDWGFPVEEAIRIKNEEIKQAERELEILQAQLDNKIEQQEIAKKQAEEENKRIETEKTVADLKGEYLEKIAEQERKWKNIKDVTGEQVTNEEKIKFYQDSLVDLMTKANGQITTSNQLYKDQVKIIEQLQAGLQPEEKKTGNEWEKKLREQLIASLEADKEEKLAEVENEKHANILKEKLTVEYNEQIKQLKLEALAVEEQVALKSVEDLANAEEEKLRIKEYYEKERKKLIISYAEENKKAGADEAKSFIDKLKEQFPELAQIITRVNNQISKIKKGIEKVADAFNKAGEVIKKVGNELNRIENVVKGLFRGVSNFQKLFSNIFSKIKGVGKIFDFNPDEALDNLLIFEDKVLTFFVETMPKLPQFIASAFESIATLLNTIFDNIDFENLLDGLVKAVVTVLKNIPKLIVKAIPKVFKAIGTLFKEFRKLLPELLTVINGLIEELFKALPNFVQVELPAFLKDIASFIPTFMKAGSEFVKTLVSALPNIVQTILDAFILLLQDPKAIADLAVSIIKAFVEVILVVVRNIGPLLKALLPAIATIIIEIFKALPELLWSLTKEIGSMILEVGKWIVNLIIDGINKMLDGISKVWTWIPGTKGIPHIPHFAKGTDNAPSGLALVGEAGPELVHFNGGEQVLNNRNTQKALVGMSNSGNTFNVTFNNLQDTSAYAMMSQLRQYNRQMAINGII